MKDSLSINSSGRILAISYICLNLASQVYAFAVYLALSYQSVAAVLLHFILYAFAAALIYERKNAGVYFWLGAEVIQIVVLKLGSEMFIFRSFAELSIRVFDDKWDIFFGVGPEYVFFQSVSPAAYYAMNLYPLLIIMAILNIFRGREDG